MSSEENQEPASASKKDQDNEKETWKTVPTKAQHTRPQRRGARGGRTPNNTARGASSRSVPHQKKRNEGPEGIRGRSFRGRRGRGRGSKPGRNQAKGAAGKYVFFLPLSSAQNGLMEMDINRAPIGSIRHAILTLLS